MSLVIIGLVIFLSIAFTSVILLLFILLLKKYELSVRRVKSKFRKYGIIFLLIGGIIGIVFISYNLGNRIAFFRKINGKTEWRYSNNQPYLYIEANTHYDLGYLTGRELSDTILDMKNLFIFASGIYGINYEEIIEMTNDYIPFIPDYYIEEIIGVAEGASYGSGVFISIKDILWQNLYLEILYGRYNPSSQNPISVAGCSAFGVINQDNSILVGQNMDLFKPFSPFGAFVLHKLNQEPLIFTYRLGGNIGFPMGKNEFGLTIITNLVQLKYEAPLTKPLFAMVRDGLSGNANVTTLVETFFENDLSPLGLNFIFADTNDLVAIQSLYNNRTVNFPEEYIVHTNTYSNPYWQNTLINPNYSKERQMYAEQRLLEACHDSELSSEEILEILGDEPIICRDEGEYGSATVAFMTTNEFGIPNSNYNVGLIPI